MCCRAVKIKVNTRKPSEGWLCHVRMKKDVSEHEVFASQVETGWDGGRKQGYNIKYDNYLAIQAVANYCH